MNRGESLGAGCGLGCIAGNAMASSSEVQSSTRKPGRYKIDIEIFEARLDTWCHKKGEKFEYLKDMAKICPWLMSSMHDFIVATTSGGTLPWRHEGTPYEKVIDPNGVTTEYVRCPDSTATLVAKITRTRIQS